ncbi:hypothetical protein [Candidatus Amarolinea dominans]|uniref:hypothetical protein n=1 Tax=Candidatus Amarolinea dominans TaxID=3140696 RepID=UPI0031369F8A|nr:hypothetical protein [Anaerolineae bacterium]
MLTAICRCIILTATAALVHAAGQALTGLGLPSEIIRWLVAANTYDGLNLLGRVLSALFDTGSVYVIFLIGRRIYSTRAALLGAAFAAHRDFHPTQPFLRL